MSTLDQRCIARLREALAEDPRTNTLDLDVFVRDGELVVRGPVETGDRQDDVTAVARGACASMPVANETFVAEHPPVRVEGRPGAVRVAAAGDLHVGRDAEGLLRLRLTTIGSQADVLLLAGDLTHHGTTDEAHVLAADLAGLPVATVAVLGNHDYHRGKAEEIRAILQDSGVHVLEGEHVVVRIRGQRVGIAGVKGFGGGFAGACGTEFGEDEMKAFIRHTKHHADRLREALETLDADIRIALTHYAPVPDTLEGERREIYPFLGSYLLEEAIDAAGCDLVVHGHAHKGVETGDTAAGIPVRNVALPVIRDAYRVYHVIGEEHGVARARPMLPALAPHRQR